MRDAFSVPFILSWYFCDYIYIYICVIILGFLFFIQTFLKHCKALSTEKYKRYINILLLLLLLMLIEILVQLKKHAVMIYLSALTVPYLMFVGACVAHSKVRNFKQATTKYLMPNV